MITAVDSSVLLDVFTADATFGARSREALRRCMREGRLVVCDAVIAEVGSAFPDTATAKQALSGLAVEHEPAGADAAWLAAEVFRAWRAQGGKRTRIVADFLVGAHACRHAERLLTRDRGFHRSFFPNLVVLDPSCDTAGADPPRAS